MKRAVLLLFLVITIEADSQDQQSAIDSLEALVESHLHSDTIRVKLLNDLSQAWYAVDPGGGLRIVEEAIQLATDISYDAGLAKAYSRKSSLLWALGEYGQAEEAARFAAGFYRQMGNTLEYAKALNNLGLNLHNTGNDTMAVRIHRQALLLFQKLDHAEGIQHSYNNLGVIELASNDYPRALVSFLAARRAATTPDSWIQANVATNLGLVYKNIGNYQKALTYHREALDKNKRLGNKLGVASSLSNIGTIYDLSDKPQEALTYYKQALEINREIGNKARIASDLTNIGIVFNGMKRFEESHSNLQRAVEDYRVTDDQNGLSIALLQLAATTDSLRYSPESVKAIQLEALHYARQSGSPMRESEALQALSGIYGRLGEWNEAMTSYQRHIILRDSIFNRENDQEIMRQQMKFDYEKREALAQSEIRRQSIIRKGLMTGAGGLMAAAVFGFVLYKRKRDAVTLKRDAEFRALVSETELKALRAQMNPHFIFNSLNAINAYVGRNEPELAQDILTEFASLMRQALETSNEREIPLEDDLLFIERYLKIERQRLKNSFTYQISVDSGINRQNTLVPPLMLQPFVENSIWHGVGKNEHGHIRIKISKTAEFLVCQVEDNGPGLQANERVTGRHSMGIKLTEDRLRIVSRYSRIDGKLEINNNKDGLNVTLFLPLNEAF